MLKVQANLREHTSLMGAEAALKNLVDTFSIRTAFCPERKLVTLNYDQIDSPKHHVISRECRGLTLEFGTWNIVARSFPRFFNAGENPAEEAKFDWGHFTAESKEDGSLMVLYKYDGAWRVNTRGSFGLGEIQAGLGITWEEGFYLGLPNETGLDVLPAGFSYVFEFCSRWNKVVRDYPDPTLFLLSVFHTASGIEVNEVTIDKWATTLGVQRPVRFGFSTLADITKFVNDQEATFEGCVLRDSTGLRLKVKNRGYVALHQLKDNGNGFAPKRLIELVHRKDYFETVSAFPEVTGAVVEAAERHGAAVGRMLATWEAAKRAKSQKEFAAVVNEHGGVLKSILFEARKKSEDPMEVLRRSGELVVKALA